MSRLGVGFNGGTPQLGRLEPGGRTSWSTTAVNELRIFDSVILVQ
jgi:hypothetical protein